LPEHNNEYHERLDLDLDHDVDEHDTDIDLHAHHDGADHYLGRFHVKQWDDNDERPADYLNADFPNDDPA
jgi:hypothetical protein